MARMAMTIVFGAACAVAIGAGAALSPVRSDDGLRADLEYIQYCASCHGLSGRGDGPVATHLARRPPDLTTLAERNGGAFPEDYVYVVIDGGADIALHGPRDMPVWGEQFGQVPGEATGAEAKPRIVGLVEYLKSIQE